MIKQGIFMLALSIIVVYLGKYLSNILHMIGNSQIFLATKLNHLLPNFGFKEMLVKALVLLLIPILFSLIIAFLYWLIKRCELPRLLEITWIVWIISTLIFVVHM